MPTNTERIKGDRWSERKKGILASPKAMIPIRVQRAIPSTKGRMESFKRAPFLLERILQANIISKIDDLK